MVEIQATVPFGANGRIGLVAQLRRVRQQSEGRLVLVQRPVGPMSSLSTHPLPVFAWQVLVLGANVEVDGKPCREIIAADACLAPVCQLDAQQMRVIVEQRVHYELQLGLQDLARVLESLESGGGKSVLNVWSSPIAESVDDDAGIATVLQTQPMATSLRKLGFRPMGSDETSGWHWSGHNEGLELYVMAMPDMFERWQLTGRSHSKLKAMWSEKVLEDELPFGAVALKVLTLWREAFGSGAPPPPHLRPALVYEQHQSDMRPLRVALPTLIADGEVLRGIRRWLSRRCATEPDGETPPDQRLALSFKEDMLCFTAGGQTYGCPACGVWVEDCQVSVREFVCIPGWVWRGRSVRLEQSVGVVLVNGVELRVLG